MDNIKIKRINELAKKSKETGLSKEEKEEQLKLRKEYIEVFRSNFKNTLDNVVVIDKDGNKREIRKKNT